MGPGDAETDLHRRCRRGAGVRREGPILSDDRPVIEYFLSLPKNDAPGSYGGPISAFENILTP